MPKISAHDICEKRQVSTVNYLSYHLYFLLTPVSLGHNPRCKQHLYIKYLHFYQHFYVKQKYTCLHLQCKILNILQTIKNAKHSSQK